MLTATQALAILTAADQEALASGEKLIDERLMAFDGSPLRVDFANTRASRKAVNALRDKYIAGGWTVKIEEGDQRDPGPCMVFSVPRGTAP